MAGVMNRIETKALRVTAEAYCIKAVSLSYDGNEQNGNEIDFGVMRVGWLYNYSSFLSVSSAIVLYFKGDYAKQILKICNKGKFRIGFKITIKKQLMKDLIKIEPSEGIIDPFVQGILSLSLN